MLQDRFGRTIEYVRLSVTDRCDLRCSYCLPKGFKGFEEPAHWLTFDETERLMRVFVALGTRRVRLTGGEPLLRRSLVWDKTVRYRQPGATPVPVHLPAGATPHHQTGSVG